jgi:hypothetical protein
MFNPPASARGTDCCGTVLDVSGDNVLHKTGRCITGKAEACSERFRGVIRDRVVLDDNRAATDDLYAGRVGEGAEIVRDGVAGENRGKPSRRRTDEENAAALCRDVQVCGCRAPIRSRVM